LVRRGKRKVGGRAKEKKFKVKWWQRGGVNLPFTVSNPSWGGGCMHESTRDGRRTQKGHPEENEKRNWSIKLQRREKGTKRRGELWRMIQGVRRERFGRNNELSGFCTNVNPY